jgi:hypothetical protein
LADLDADGFYIEIGNTRVRTQVLTDTNPADGSVCTENWDLIIGISACAFVEEYCTDTQTYNKELGDMASIIPIDSMYVHHTCTYKVLSTTGAPGFQFDAREFPDASFIPWYDDGSRPTVNASDEVHP